MAGAYPGAGGGGGGLGPYGEGGRAMYRAGPIQELPSRL